jgi:hypothetical protein
MRSILSILLATMVVIATACDTDTEETSPQDAFWENLLAHCGDAFPGGLVLEPPGDEMLTGEELLIAHFRTCSENEIRIPFHIELPEDDSWDRSRTWILTHHGDSLEIRHDHRKPDGTDDDVTMYGGFTVEEGTMNRQEFKSVERTEETGQWRGWRLEIEPGERYTYGTIRDGDWSWRVDFDLCEPMDPPPAPWVHE